MTTRGRRFPAEVLTPQEARAIIAACSTRSATGVRNAALFAVLYRSGLRIGEALALWPKDVALIGTITVLHGKGDKMRIVGIDDEALMYVVRWVERRPRVAGVVEHDAPLFCTLDGRPMSAGYVRDALRRTAAKAGVTKRVHPHGLRHTHAAELMAEGVPANIIQGQLGHTSLQTTDTYLRHIAPQERIDRIRAREWADA